MCGSARSWFSALIQPVADLGEARIGAAAKPATLLQATRIGGFPGKCASLGVKQKMTARQRYNRSDCTAGFRAGNALLIAD
jgi:hypothetical protein